MKRKLFLIILSVTFTLCSTASVYAADIPANEIHEFNVSGEIVITDPNTGESWNWDLPTSHISSDSANVMSLSTSSNYVEEYAEVSVDAREYLIKTLTNPVDAEKVLRDNITLTAGLRYSVDTQHNLIAVYKAYGSAPDNGDYYACYKEFYYANPSVFSPVKKTPVNETWSYTTNSTPGGYSSDNPPYALLDCRVTVAGMESSYRVISVICKLEFA